MFWFKQNQKMFDCPMQCQMFEKTHSETRNASSPPRRAVAVRKARVYSHIYKKSGNARAGTPQEGGTFTHSAGCAAAGRFSPAPPPIFGCSSDTLQGTRRRLCSLPPRRVSKARRVSSLSGRTISDFPHAPDMPDVFPQPCSTTFSSSRPSTARRRENSKNDFSILQCSEIIPR